MGSSSSPPAPLAAFVPGGCMRKKQQALFLCCSLTSIDRRAAEDESFPREFSIGPRLRVRLTDEMVAWRDAQRAREVTHERYRGTPPVPPRKQKNAEPNTKKPVSKARKRVAA